MENGGRGHGAGVLAMTGLVLGKETEAEMSEHTLVLHGTNNHSVHILPT